MDDQLAVTRKMMMQFIRMNKKFQKFEKNPIEFGDGQKLYPSEIHILDAVGSGVANNVTVLSQKFGITKGAVSQVVNKLHEKQLIKKEKIEGNAKEVKLTLTSHGRNAFKIQDELHKNFENEFFNYFKNLEQDKVDSYLEIMDTIDLFMDKVLNDQKPKKK
ncbi:regulatory protein MarR [Methanobacterium lacus]|uniref:Regulatory protein MarR n=1 Tax=Methanobacterium lacus (strain AL-21) TaxID=877455 RepID=F0TB04_METLA|nr:MarR family winged helix-turn-helix transcriptional regulator [Methanobacterium lacus]ADZ10150.1 regulatory protein MarR [Methanobacterium lacus]